MALKNKTVVITGGAKGIGAACARLFSEEKANVCILDIDGIGERLAEELGEGSLFIKCDVSGEKAVRQAIEQTVDKFGDIDILINNAGIQRYSTVTETSLQEWEHVMKVNLTSAFLCSKYVIPSMEKKEKGCIINVASVQSFISQNNVAPYTTSKTALLGLTRSIAVDYAPKIRCIAICPGTIDTPMLRDAIQLSPDPDEVFRECENMHLTKRVGSSREVAELIAFVSDDRAGFITGQAIRIDGGLGISIGGSKRD